MHKLALIGGEEFSDGFERVHAWLLNLSGGKRVAFLPTCAADDGDETVTYWCSQAKEKLGALGAQVAAPRIIDRQSANDPTLVKQIKAADWIYFGGGYPHVAMRILKDSQALAEIYQAADRGVLISGSSGGAMLMCSDSWVVSKEMIAQIGKFWEGGVPYDFDPPLPTLLKCLGLVSKSYCWPHFNRVFIEKWTEKGLIVDHHILIGVDEQTALVQTGSVAEVWGNGTVNLIDAQLKKQILHEGNKYKLPE